MVNPKPKAKCPPFKIRDFQIYHNNTYVFKWISMCIYSITKKNKGNIKKWIFLPSHISKNSKPKAKCPPFKIRDFQICHNNTNVFKWISMRIYIFSIF